MSRPGDRYLGPAVEDMDQGIVRRRMLAQPPALGKGKECDRARGFVDDGRDAVSRGLYPHWKERALRLMAERGTG